MNKEYYLIPKELIDSRIEGLNKDKKITNNLKSQNPQYIGDLPVISATLFELHSLTQQSELVEVEENIDEYYKEMVQSNEAKDYNAWKFTKAKEGYFFCNFVKDYHENKGFKLIKTITK